MKSQEEQGVLILSFLRRFRGVFLLSRGFCGFVFGEICSLLCLGCVACGGPVFEGLFCVGLGVGVSCVSVSLLKGRVRMAKNWIENLEQIKSVPTIRN